MTAFSAALLFGALLQAWSPVPQDPGTSYLFAVEAPAPDALRLLRERFDVLENRGTKDSVEVVVMPEERVAFRGLGLDVRLLARGRPFREIAAERRAAGPAAPDANYYTVAEVEAKLAEFETNFPAIARKVNITTLVGGPKTVNGHDLFAIKISDNPAVDEDEPVILIAAQHHARELNAPHMVIGAAQRILSAYGTDPALTKIVDEHEIYIVPTVNPDGVDHVWNVDNNWRKNRRNNGGGVFGVDNNRNYPFMWSSSCSGSSATNNETYKGPTPASEAENQVLMRFGDLKRIERYLDFHSSGREVLNTFNACITPSAPVVALISRYRDELRTPMTFGFRAPSGSGEAPEYHWTSSGALSFLAEVSTAFQPAWSSTVAEEVRVWPGIRRFLDFAPAVAGHVRSLNRETPLEAEVVVAGLGFVTGEKNFSEKAFGRYKVWLPPGSWQLVFRAPGHRDETVAVTVTAYDVTQVKDVVLTPIWADATLAKSGSERLGTRVQLDYSSPGDAGLGYFIPIGLGDTPGTPIGTRTLPLNPELLALSLNLAPVLTANLGVLSGSATATARFDIPPLPALIGFDFFFVGITLEDGFPLGVKKFSTSVKVNVRP